MTTDVQARRVVAVASLAWLGVLVIWAIAVPPLRAPDEPAHLSTALRLAFERTYPDPGTAVVDRSVSGAAEWLGFPVPYVSGPLGEPPADPPTLGSLRESTPSSTAPDQMTQHPPLGPLVFAAAATVADIEERTPAQAVLLLRLVAVLLAVPLPWLVWRCALAVGASPVAAAAASFVPSGWPHLAHITSSVSHASLLLVTTTAALLGSVRLAGGDLRARTALATGLATSAALLTKGLALGLGVGLLVAVVAAGTRHGWQRTTRAAAVLLVACLPGLAWYAANIVRFGAVQPGGWPPGFFDPSQQPPFDARFLTTYLDGVSGTLWFNPLEFEIPLPNPVHRVLTAAAVALVAAGFVLARDRLGYVVLLLAPATALALTLYGTVVEPEATGTVFAGARGRYLHVAGAVLVAAVALVATRMPRRRTAMIPVVTGTVSAAALVAVLTHFWLGEDVLHRASAAGAWWPGGSALLTLGAVAATGATVAGVVLLAHRPPATVEVSRSTA